MELIETTDGQVVSVAKPKPKTVKKSKPKTKKPAKSKVKKPASKKKSVKKTAKSKVKKPASKKKSVKKTVKRGRPATGPDRSERIDMRVTKADKARVVAKAKKLRRTVTSVILEAVEKVK